MMLAFLERRLGERVRMVCDRFRAALLRLRGAQVGAKSRIGAGLIVHRPWLLRAGERCQIEHDVFLKLVDDKAELTLGREVFIGRGCEFDVSGSLIIGDHVLVAPGCFITDHNHRYAAHSLVSQQGCDVRPVRIENDVWLGANVIVLPGVTIGRGAVVAAAAVVTADVEAMSIVAGVPARKIGQRD